MPAGNLSVYRGTVAYAAGKFGNARSAALVSGMMDDFLGTPGTQNTLGTGTIEFWCKIPSASALRVIAGHMTWWWIGHDAGGNLICYVGSSAGEGGAGQITLSVPPTNVANGSWWHVALVFNAGVASLYAGTSGTGNRLAEAGSAVGGGASLNVDGTTGIGGFDESTYGAYDLPDGAMVDEFRVSTTARYSGATYTIPTAAFTSDANTYGIWHFDGNLDKDASVSTTSVTPTAPTFTDPSGSASDTYTIPTTAGVDYQIGGSTVAAGTYPGTGTVTITAVAQAGYAITGTASWSHTFSTVTTATATAPTFADPSGTASDTYTIPTTVGVDYRIGGSIVAAGAYPGTGTVTVTATAQDGYDLTGTTSWSNTFTDAGPYRWRVAHEPLVYAAGAYPARPPGAKSVTWIGPSTPPGWLPNDIWVDNS